MIAVSASELPGVSPQWCDFAERTSPSHNGRDIVLTATPVGSREQLRHHFRNIVI